MTINTSKYLFYIVTIVLLLACPSVVRAQIECEDTCTHIHGIDISHYEKQVYWETVGENSKMAFVYIKATEGQNFVDNKYAENIMMAHKYGLKVGAYHFWRPKVPQQLQVDNFLACCRPQDQDLLPMMDIEVTSNLPRQALRDSLAKFLTIMENSIHQKPLIYTGQSYYNDYLLGMLHGYKVMMARYSTKEPEVNDDLDITLWQYTEKGRINGIPTYVDKSRFLGNHNLREIRWKKGRR